MESTLTYLQELLDVNPEVLHKLIGSAMAVVLLALVRLLVVRMVWRRTEDVRTRYTWRKSVTYITVTLSLFILGRIWFAGFQSLTTYLGLVSAGIAIALKDPLVNFAAWVFILWRRPFTVGDRVEISGHRGDVIDLRIFQFTLMEIGNWVDADQSTGRVIRIPNGKVFTEMLGNYSKGFKYIWDEIPVLLTFESDWRAAKSLLREIVEEHAEHLSESAAKRVREASANMMIFYKTLTPVVYTTVRDSGVLLTMRYLTDPRQRRMTEQAIWEDILDAFAKRSDIDFAYPTQRFYNNMLEGKPEARAGAQ
ncbi:MAG: mechanosensitive ion channel family protein [Candidatus Zixiibacteriota bacterium]